jgi:hypothetical protein
MADRSIIGSTTAQPEEVTANYMSPPVIGGIVLAVWALLSNCVLIMAILRSEHRRKVSFNLHVCNLCLTGVLMGGLVLPFRIDMGLYGQWVHSDNLCRVWLMASMVLATVSVMVLVAMIFDRFVLFSCPEAAEGCCKFVMSAILIVFPWAFGTGIVVCIYLFGETGLGVKEDHGLCVLNLDETFAIVAEIACYAAPSLVAIALLVITSLTWCFKKEELRDMDFSQEREHKGWQVFTSWVITIAVIGMWFPIFALHVLKFILGTTWPIEWFIAAVWIAYANSGLNPILWMIMPRLRQSIKALCCCCCKKLGHDDDYLDDETSAAMIEFSEK